MHHSRTLSQCRCRSLAGWQVDGLNVVVLSNYPSGTTISLKQRFLQNWLQCVSEPAADDLPALLFNKVNKKAGGRNSQNGTTISAMLTSKRFPSNFHRSVKMGTAGETIGKYLHSGWNTTPVAMQLIENHR
jgi:hypothetical protein